MLDAIEKGVVTNSTARRLEELELRLSNITEQLEIERTKFAVILSKEEVECFITTALQKEPRRLLDSLIEKIILYDDKIEITYRYTNRKRPDDDRRGVLFYTGTGEVCSARTIDGKPISRTLKKRLYMNSKPSQTLWVQLGFNCVTCLI